MKEVKRLPPRSEMNPADCWDLGSLFPSAEAWDEAFSAWEKDIEGFARFQGTLGRGAEDLVQCLQFLLDHDRAGERLGVYAYLKKAEDATSGDGQRRFGRYLSAASRSGQASSFIQPEVLAIPSETIEKLLADDRLAPFRLMLRRWLRFKPHTLNEREEKLLAMQAEMAQAAGQAFRQLTDADMKFGEIENEKGEWIELSHATFASLLHSPRREVRQTAFDQYYRQFAGHQYTLAATLEGSIQRDLYYARARNYPSALEAALFPDNVPVAVYDNLIAAVRRRLPAVHRYYDVRRRKMQLPDIHQYDTYVPILADLSMRHTWDEAVSLVMRALEPLGSDYCGTLEEGLCGRWCDRYENQGKQSGAFSCGSFDGDPYILMNYQEDVLDHVFTLAHEAGHSMHSHRSAAGQPYQYYDYVIFVAEVASTFNEQLLSDYLARHAGDDRHRAYFINRQIDAVRATIVRQTMFAEFEKITHATAESGEPLTLDRFREIYHQLLVDYFGPDFVLDEQLDLECLRIPHFYRAFYVYKYATGMSAAIALARRVSQGGEQELKDYLAFLSAGCSKDPLDLLRDAGVDMEKPEPVETALAQFEQLVAELDALI